MKIPIEDVWKNGRGAKVLITDGWSSGSLKTGSIVYFEEKPDHYSGHNPDYPCYTNKMGSFCGIGYKILSKKPTIIIG